MANHKHKWDVGDVIWKGEIPKIKTTCLICKREIIVDFKFSVKSLYTSEEEGKNDIK